MVEKKKPLGLGNPGMIEGAYCRRANNLRKHGIRFPEIIEGDRPLRVKPTFATHAHQPLSDEASWEQKKALG